MNKKLHITLLLLLTIFFLSSFFIHPREVVCENINCGEINSTFKDELQNAPFFSIRNKISTAYRNPKINLILWKVDLLGRLVITTQVKTPSLAILTQGGHASLFSSTGEFIGESSDFSGPTVVALNKFNVENTPFIVGLSQQIFSLLEVTNAYIKDDSLYFDTKSSITTIYPLQGDIDLLLGETIASFSQLNGASEKFNIIGDTGKVKKVSQIDFRFEKPTLR